MKIVIQTDFDFTPTGKRRVAYSKQHRKIWGYVSGSRYMTFKNFEEAIRWRDNKTNLLPQEECRTQYER